MANKFVVIAVDQGGAASFWNGKGWSHLSRINDLPDGTVMPTFESKAACAVRDNAKAHQINAGVHFHIVRVQS